jgi:hypothetical protein
VLMSSATAAPALCGSSATTGYFTSGRWPNESQELALAKGIRVARNDPAVPELFTKQVHTKPFGRVFRVLRPSPWIHPSPKGRVVVPYRVSKALPSFVTIR